MATTATEVADSRVVHSQAPRRSAGRSYDLIRQLNGEWDELSRCTVTAATTSSWAARVTRLRDLPTLADIAREAATTSGERSDTLFVALLDLADQGERLAVRTVLHLMLGKVVLIARSVAATMPGDSSGFQEAVSVTVLALLEVISSYPLQARPRRVPANLALETLNHVRGRRVSRVVERPIPPEVIVEIGATEHSAFVGLRPSSVTLVDVLLAARRDAVITAEEGQLLIDVYTNGRDGNRRMSCDVAAEYGVSANVVSQRCGRAVRKIAAWQSDSPTTGGGLVVAPPLQREVPRAIRPARLTAAV